MKLVPWCTYPDGTVLYTDIGDRQSALDSSKPIDPEVIKEMLKLPEKEEDRRYRK
jgi:hypothetical protein